MSERLNGTHGGAGKPALRDNMPMHGTANEGMGRPQSSARSDGRAGAEAQEACKRLELLLRETVHRKRCSQPTVVQGMSSATPFAG
jgi:hypothetical protein